MGVQKLGKMIPGVVLVFLCYVSLSTGQGLNVEVELPEMGRIRGILGMTSREQTEYYTFHGIPYAEESSYMGKNRFKPSSIRTTPYSLPGEDPLPGNILIYCPQEEILHLSDTTMEIEERVSKSQDIMQIFAAIHENKRQRSRKFRQFSSPEELKKAYEDEEVRDMGQEDCLTVNINTRTIPTDPEDKSQLRPVVVFFHGGGSDAVWGSAFTALRMLEDDVVLVTLNYRLGVLGALNLGILDAPGNAGQYDGIVCLEWINKYIKYFGGDPDRVTITGQSAGSMMVTNLMLTPMIAKDSVRSKYFHGVWGFSGAAISVWATAEHPSLRHHLDVAKFAGCYNEGDEMQAVVECLQEADQQILVKALVLYMDQETAIGRLGFDAKMTSIQNPELASQGLELFMPRHPFEVLEAGEGLNVPIVLGATRHDGSFPLDDIYNNYIAPNKLDKNETFIRNDLLPHLIEALGVKDSTGELYHTMARTYLGDSSLTGTLEDKLPGMMDMVTIMAFKAAEFDTLRLQSKFHTPHAYFYSLDYQGRWSLYNFLWGEQTMPGGICHTDDLIYFFWLGPLMNEDMKVSRRWMEYFINFAKYGNPNGEDVDETDEFWPRFNPLTHASLSLNRTDKVIYNTPDTWIGPAHELDWSKFTEPTTQPPTVSPPGAGGNIGQIASLTTLIPLTIVSVFSYALCENFF